MNKFDKVSFEQYILDRNNCKGLPELSNEQLLEEYTKIQIPKRGTKGSAGYDFFAPFDIELKPGESIKIPTGIKVNIDEGKFLAIVPRSGLGFKYRLQLDNTIGIIDEDYIFSDNEGHIMAKLTNDSKDPNNICVIKQDKGIMQGIFIQYFLTVNDDTIEERNGGFGSTTK